MKGGRCQVESPATLGITGFLKTAWKANYAIGHIFADLSYLLFWRRQKNMTKSK